MPYNHNFHNRNSIRMQGYDYSQPGAYFITICTHHKECLFGEINSGKMKLSTLGEIAYYQWIQLPYRFATIKLDTFVIMPNHLHGIIIINETQHPISRRGEAGENRHGSSPKIQISPASPSNTNDYSLDVSKPGGTISGSIGAIIQNFKSLTTRKINILLRSRNKPIWQRNYYEHIIRGETDYERIVEYIENNPISWVDDEYNV